MTKGEARAPRSPPRGGSVWSTAWSPRWPAPSQAVSAPAPPAEPSLKANESAAAGCAATAFPVFFLNSAGGGRSAAPSLWLSGNSPPLAPLSLPAPPQVPYRKIPICQSLPGPPAESFPAAAVPAALPPGGGITRRSQAPLALKPSPRGGGHERASVTAGLL